MSIGLMIIQIVISIALILTVVLQVRKTSKASGIFGGGTTADHSGKKGKEAFLVKITTGVAILFMVSSLLLSFIK
ncbi:MAG: preprotein translocase subunit SecG [Candidatus Atribacteria bacterium]|jgi:preprotein translocase subunit SecG|nr:preprotein translocase subunit SecG [Candidatus Atribacteria bacterium]